MSSTQTIRKILIANRGEIARRIMRTVRALGMQSVAVFSDADEGAPHVKEADEAVRIGPAPSSESYLDVAKIVSAARSVGADAVHPGYGFLSERAELAQACIDAGLLFIGPTPQAIARMGSKIESKRIAQQAGVPVIEGFSAERLAHGEVVERATALGYPVLIKASAGGGGRGMRIVRSAEDMPEALVSAEREARSAFGDGTLLVERYLEAPRHIEIQIFGDTHGNVIHLFERECSIQRHHQKVIEEAPSPAVSSELRAEMGRAAVELGRAIGYTGAGTVELVLDRKGAFYFLEVNTRLQVEHPVTEAITGLDLVRLQIEVAQGKPLTVTQHELTYSGHAIEARLYAEDAAHDFLPATGRVALYREPELPGLRIDSGVERGTEVSVHYDPMLAKVIAKGATREEARKTLVRGLRSFGVGGLTTNREFLVRVLEHVAFAARDTHTHFIEQHSATLMQDDSAQLEPLARTHAIAAALHLHALRRARTPGPTPAGVPSGFRNNPWRKQEERFTAASKALAVRYRALPSGDYEVETDGFAKEQDAKPVLRARVLEATDDALVAEIDGVRRRLALAHIRSAQAHRVVVFAAELSLELERVPRFPPRTAAQVAGGCVAPMTGVVRKVAVAVGDRVHKGDLLLMLEAMKMEHRLLAHADGLVSQVRVREGQMVDPDDVLIVVDAEAVANG
jgi:acetyl-CoA carboxylase biotin carboxylase subunit